MRLGKESKKLYLSIMFFYLSIVFVILLISFFAKDHRKQALYGGIIILFFSSMRATSVGVDTGFYTSFFVRVSELDWDTIFDINDHIEKGFIVFCKLLSYISTSEHFLLFVTSFISIVPLMVFISRYSYSPSLSWIIYILSYQFDYEMLVMRQSMAMAINLIALMLLMETKTRKNFILSLALCLLSSSFHLGALFMLPLFILGYHVDNVKTKHYLFMLVSGVVFFIFLGMLLRFLNNVGLVATSYLHQRNIGSGIGRILLPGCILMVFILLKKSLYRHDKNTNFWEFSCMLTIFAAITSFWVYPFGRAVFYYRIYEIIYLPNLIFVQNFRENKRILFWLIFLAYFITYVYFYTKGNDYRFWG